MARSDAPIIQLNNIGKNYGNISALRGVNLSGAPRRSNLHSRRQGEAGKSTLISITPTALPNGYGAIIIAIVGSTVVWMSIRYLSRTWLFRKVDDTLGVIYTHGIAGSWAACLVGLVSDPNMNIYPA